MDCVIFLCYIYVSNWSDLVSQCFVMQGLFLFAFFTSFIVSETSCKRQNGNILVTLETLRTLRTLRTIAPNLKNYRKTVANSWQNSGNYFFLNPRYSARLLFSSVSSSSNSHLPNSSSNFLSSSTLFCMCFDQSWPLSS